MVAYWSQVNRYSIQVSQKCKKGKVYELDEVEVFVRCGRQQDTSRMLDGPAQLDHRFSGRTLSNNIRRAVQVFDMIVKCLYSISFGSFSNYCPMEAKTKIRMYDWSTLQEIQRPAIS